MNSLEADASLAERYHENTKIFPFTGLSPDIDPVVKANRTAAEFAIETLELCAVNSSKSYPTANVIALPSPSLLEDIPLGKALCQRHSSLLFDADAMLTLDALSTLLKYAYGFKPNKTNEPLRKYVPAAGGLYPLEFYVLGLKVEGCAHNSLFHYYPKDHTLEFLGVFPTHHIVREVLIQPEHESSSAIIFITACFPRVSWKYGDRGYRYLLLDAGHAGQNLCLISGALDLHICPVEGFYDDAVHDLLFVDGISEIVVYAFAIGAGATV